MAGGTVQDVTEHHRAQERLNHLAHFDLLTGLPNRLLLQDRLCRAMNEADRNDRLVAVMFLDLDRFKIINDTLGHEAGDELLKAVAVRLQACVRAVGTACAQAQAWCEVGFSQFRISVNISIRQFQNRSLAKMIGTIWKKRGLIRIAWILS